MIVSAVIALAQSLKSGVIAEGVETEDHLNFLKQRQCADIQGHLFYKPLSVEAFGKILLHNEPK